MRERVREPGRRADDDEVAGSFERQRPALERLVQRDLPAAVPVPVRGRRVDETAALAAHLHEAELRDVARDRRLDDVVTHLVQRLGELVLCPELPLPDEAEDQRLALAAIHRSTSAKIESAWSTSSAETVRGGVKRTASPATVVTSFCSSAAATSSPAGFRVCAATSRPAPRASTTPGRAARPARSCSPRACTFASSSSSIRSTTAQAAALATRFPPNVEAWSPGTKPRGAAFETRSAPIGRPFARPFVMVTRSGRTSV